MTWLEEQKLKEYEIPNPGKANLQSVIDDIDRIMKDLDVNVSIVKTWHENMPENTNMVNDVDSPIYRAMNNCRDLIKELKVIWDATN